MDKLIEQYKTLARRSKAMEKVTELNESLDDRKRISRGGIYSWQPFRWQRETSDDAKTVTTLKQGEQTRRSRHGPKSQGLSLAGHVDGSSFASGNWEKTCASCILDRNPRDHNWYGNFGAGTARRSGLSTLRGASHMHGLDSKRLARHATQLYDYVG